MAFVNRSDTTRTCTCGRQMVWRKYNGAVRHVGVEMQICWLCPRCDLEPDS